MRGLLVILALSSVAAIPQSLRPSAPSPALKLQQPGFEAKTLRPSALNLNQEGAVRLRGGHAAVTAQGNGTPLELLVCISGIYFCYLYYGVLQEDLLTSKYDGKSFKEVCSLLFLQAIQCAIGAASARVACTLSPQPDSGWQNVMKFEGFSSTLWPMYMQVGFCYVLAMFFSNSALFYINYPTQVIVKSCKMIPVMAVSVLWRKKQYPVAAYVRVAMVTLGIIMFTFFKDAGKAARSQAKTQVFGLCLALLSLVMDGFVGPAQEEIFSKFSPSTHQMMYYVNGWAMVLLAVGLLITGDGFKALSFTLKHPSIFSKMFQFGLMSATGQFFVFFLVRSFSALTLVTVTTTRKFFTVLASIFWFKHSISTGQWASVALVFTGLAWEETSKYITKQRLRMAKDAEARAAAVAAPAPTPEAPAPQETEGSAPQPPAEGAEAETPPAAEPEGEAAPEEKKEGDGN